jgi:PUB domain/UBX domain
MSSRGSDSIDDSKKAALDGAISQVLNNNFDADSKTCILTLIKVLDNVLQQPHNDKVRSIRLGNPAFSKKVVEKRGHHILVACGFAPTKNSQNEEFLSLDAEKEDTQLIVHTRHTLARVAVHQLQCPPDTLPTFQPPKPKIHLQQSTNAAGFTSTSTNTGFNIYQGQRYDGKSAAVGANLGPPEGWKSKTEQQLLQLQQQQAKLQEKLQKAAGGRDWTVLLPEQSSSSITATGPAAAPLPLTMSSKEDAQLLAQHIQNQHKARLASENRGFTTKAMRDLEQLKKANVYSHTQLAIQFPNAIVVKANFLPQETIQVVTDGLRQSVFAENVELPEFQLYTTPPRQVLGLNKKLHELGLVPAAKIYISWNQPLTPPAGSSSGNSSIAWFVRPELLQQPSFKGPAMPMSMAVVQIDDDSKKDNDKKPPALESAATNKRKKTKEDKEANLLARMLGK